MIRVAGAALALPAICTVGALTCIAYELAGRTPPMAIASPQNIAEASGMGSAADIWRFFDQGEQPERVYDIRPEIISPQVTRASAVEAAIWSREVDVVRFLVERGALSAPAARRRMACLGAELGTKDIVEYLDPAHGAGCDGGSVADEIAARTIGAAGR